MPKPRRRSPEKPGQEALHREIPNQSLSVTLTGAGTVDALNLGDFANGGTPGNGTSLADRWIYLTPVGMSVYLRRYTGTIPTTASMNAGKAWTDGETQEFWVDGNSSMLLAAEGSAAGELLIEWGDGN